jgi:glucose/arabinose dehydrogenase
MGLYFIWTQKWACPSSPRFDTTSARLPLGSELLTERISTPISASTRIPALPTLQVDATIVPDLLFEAHSSALDIVFYDGAQFPAEYKGNAFVALKGSWNRAEPTGYKVVRVPFKDGRPEGYYENFVTGFWISGERRAEVWGRPAALAVTRDGALLVADDTGGTIWRIAYTGQPDGAQQDERKKDEHK